MPIRRSSITPQFEFDDATNRYRHLASGRFVSREQVRHAVDQYIDKKSDTIRELAEQLRRREISISQWQRAMESEIAKSHLANAVAAKGGFERMTPADFGRVGRLVKAELGGVKGVHGGLRGFAKEIENGLPLDGRFLQRARQYTNAGRHTYHVVDRLENQTAGMNEERSMRSVSDSCAGCIEAEAQGWQPIGTLPLPGTRDCLRACKCSMQYRQAGPQEQDKNALDLATRNPFDEKVPQSHMEPHRVLEDVKRTQKYLRENFDTKSRWNGKVVLISARLEAAGRFLADGTMELATENLSRKSARWDTIFHESLHSIEDARDHLRYTTYRGWIEAPLEMVLRLSRDHMRESLKLDTLPAAAKFRDENHPYSAYIKYTESVRKALGEESKDDFYFDLFATPVDKRIDRIKEKAQLLPDKRREDVMNALREAVSALGGELK